MKIENVTVNIEEEGVRLTLNISKGALEEAINFYTKFEAGEYEIKRIRNKRSNDANAYAWSLITRLAEVLRIGTTECYRELVKEYGVHNIVPIRQDAIAFFVSSWQSRGLGWTCEDMGECRTRKGYNNIVVYYGTSVYDTKQFTRFLDGVKDECRQQGIETLTDDEISKMIQGGNNE